MRSFFICKQLPDSDSSELYYMKKKAIALILTDTHLSENNIEVSKSIFAQAIEIAKQHKFDTIYHGGDIFDSRKAQKQDVLNAFDDILEMFDENNMHLIATPGNHDKTNYNSERSFLDSYRWHGYFQLYRETIPQVVYRNSVDKIFIYMMPFFRDDKYIEGFKDFKAKKGVKNVLITHIGVNGAVMNNGMKVSSGINEELFCKFDKVLIGHYHDKSYYSKSIEYIGASFQHNFGENEYKGLTVLFDDLSTDTIALKFPKYLKYEMEAKDLSLKEVEKLKDNNGNHIRVVLTGEEKDIKSVDKQRLLALGVDVKAKQDELNPEEIESRVEAFDDASLFSAFETFCEKNELLYEEGLQLLNKAFNGEQSGDNEEAL